MSDQFISVITNEAMSRVCYDGGWNLKPWKFFVSETDVLEGWTESAIYDADGNVRPEVYDYLKEYTTEKMQQDYDAGNVWYNNRFSSVSKASANTLTHHLNIPGDIAIDTKNKTIRTIFFLYQDNYGGEFLYALARSNSEIMFEVGITQSFFFNFTVSNSDAQDVTEFVLNYSCAHEIEDHNNTQGENIHSDLMARDGSRTFTGIVSYSMPNPNFTQDNQLITKQYVDKLFADYIGDLINDSICPPGKMDWWPGEVKTIPHGWAIRMGQLLSKAENPKLYKVIGDRYKLSTDTDTTKFRLMDDRGLFIRGTEVNIKADGSVQYNTNLLNLVGFGQTQTTAGPNIKGQITADNTVVGNSIEGGSIKPQGAFHKLRDIAYDASTKGSGNGGILEFDANRSNGLYQDNVNEFRPTNRNYIPIIRLG